MRCKRAAFSGKERASGVDVQERRRRAVARRSRIIQARSLGGGHNFLDTWPRAKWRPSWQPRANITKSAGGKNDADRSTDRSRGAARSRAIHSFDAASRRLDHAFVDAKTSAMRSISSVRRR
jgi:hypothetical protein